MIPRFIFLIALILLFATLLLVGGFTTLLPKIVCLVFIVGASVLMGMLVEADNEGS